MLLRLEQAVEDSAEVVETGACARLDDGRLNPLVVSRLNEAGIQLSQEGDWAESLHEMIFRVYNKVFATPADVVAIREAILDDCQVDLRSKYFAYMNTAPGCNPCAGQGWCEVNAIDRGFHPVMRDPVRCAPILVVSDREEDKDTAVTLQGDDCEGNPVRDDSKATHHKKGEDLPVFGPDCPVYTDHCYMRVTSAKKGVTKGVISLYSYDPDSGEYHILAMLDPEEKYPSYRRWEIPSFRVGDVGTMRALVKRAWERHYTNPEDILPIGNSFALKMMVKAMSFARNNNDDQYEKFRQIAIGALNRQKANETKGQEPEVDYKVRNGAAIIMNHRQRRLSRHRRVWR